MTFGGLIRLNGLKAVSTKMSNRKNRCFTNIHQIPSILLKNNKNEDGFIRSKISDRIQHSLISKIPF